MPNLLRLIRSQGFLDARLLDYRLIRSPKSRFVDVEVAVQLGDRFFVREVDVVGAVGLSSQELAALLSLDLQKPLNPTRVEEVANALLTAHQKLGFLGATVQVEYRARDLQSYGRDVDLEFQIQSGPQILVGRRLVQGLSRTKERVVLRELDRVGLEPAEPWSPQKVRDVEQRLLGLGVFGSSKVEAIGGSLNTRREGGAWAQRKDLRTIVAERPGGSIEFGPGFRTDLGAIGFAEFNYRDIGGMNRSVVLRTQASRKIRDYQFVEQKHAVTFLEPYFVGLPLRLRLGVSYAKEDETVFLKGVPVDGFNSEEAALSVAVEREFWGDMRLVVGLYSFAKPRIFDIIKAPSDDRNTYRVATSGLTWIWDRRDNLFLPTSGFVLTTSFEHSDPRIGSDKDAHFSVLRWSGAQYFRLPAGSVLATSLSLAQLWGLGETSGVPENRRLVLGGRSSIRSLSEKAIRFDQPGVKNESSAEAKVEYRQPIILDLGVAYFFDVGQLWAREVGRSGWRRAIGFGVRYNTAVGPLALDFAFNLDRRNLENELKLQFSIGSF
jgi:outer membrane protein assembly factor BamA